MAEFSEVMKQLNRICTKSDCTNCPMESMGCCGNIGFHCSNPIKAERIEKIVMQWAAEHPEPKYPSWEEYLCSIGFWSYNSLSKPIPADIAKRLGIEPKEG